MTTFAYVALEPSGKRKKGFIEAANRDAAIAQINASGTSVLEIQEQESVSASKAKSAATKGKITKSDLALFTRRLADLAAAGLPLDRVLQVVAEQSESPHLSAIAEESLEDVRSGMQVSQALAKHPKYFNDVYTQTLRAGEASGQFSGVAQRLADFQEKEVIRRSQVVSALIYPAILTFVAVMAVIFLLTFVVPKMSGIFADMGDDYQ